MTRRHHLLAALMAAGLLLLTGNFTVAQTPQLNHMQSDTTKMIITRAFNAPLEKVWNAWSKGELVKRWWGPMGFTAPVANINFKKGGVSLVCMRSPDGFEIYNTWTYTLIAPMNRIEFVQHFTDAAKNVIKPSSIGLPPGIPDEVPHAITFKDLGNGKTEITIVESGYTNAQVVEISKAGMASVLDKLAAEVERK
jgi:uncharacterized protein YndB with AHSA1/START domain